MKSMRIDGVIGWQYEAAMLQEFLDDADGDDIHIAINSPGGIIPEGFSMINALREYSGAINIQIDYAASMASVVAMTPGAHVTMWENSSMMMIHRAWGVAIGNADELQQSGDNLRKVENISISNYLERAGDNLDEDELRDMLEKETVLNAREAKKYGLIDQILRDKKQQAPKAMQIAPGVAVDFEKFAAKLNTQSTAATVHAAQSLRDVERALRDVGHYSQSDAKRLIASIRQFSNRRDGDPTSHRDGGLDPDHNRTITDCMQLCERISQL